MLFFLLVLLFINSLIAIVMYRILFKKRKLYTDRFAMIMSMSISGVLSMNCAMIMQFLFTIDMVNIVVFTIIIGGCMGIIFGSLVKFQSILSGFTHGVSGSLMGNMLGVVIKDPTICSLPATYLASVEENMIIFSLFGTALVISTISLVHYSLKV